MTNKSTEDLIKELEALLDKGYTAEVINFLLNCLSGVPYVGGAFSATAGLRTDLSQKKIKIFLKRVWYGPQRYARLIL